MGAITSGIEKGIRGAENVLGVVAGCMLMAMMLLGAVDVVGRYLFNSPVTGALETSEILMGGFVFLSWAYTQSKKAHVSVDLLFALYPPRVQATLSFIMNIIVIALFALILWQSAAIAISDYESGKLVRIILIPIYPFKLMVPVGAFFIAIEFILQTIHLVPKVLGKEK